MNDLTDLTKRSGLPEDQLFLARQYPSDRWLTGEEITELGKFWLSVHRYFRQQSTAIEQLIGGTLEGRQDVAAVLPAFQRAMGEMLSHLEGHHNIEDHNYFPQFIRIEPRLKTGFEIMDSDHHLIHDAIHDLAQKSREFIIAGSAPKPDRSESDRLANALGGTFSTFRRHMLRHLDDEEDLVIPLIMDRKLG